MATKTDTVGEIKNDTSVTPTEDFHIPRELPVQCTCECTTKCVGACKDASSKHGGATKEKHPKNDKQESEKEKCKTQDELYKL